MFDRVLDKPLTGLYTTQKMKFLADLVTFTEEILDGKLHFLCSDFYSIECMLTSVSEANQQIFTCSKSTIETLEKSVKYVQS